MTPVSRVSRSQRKARANSRTWHTVQLGGQDRGVARAPAAIRQAGLLAHLQGAGITVKDVGDVALQEPTAVRDPVSHLIAPGAMNAMIATPGQPWKKP